MVLQMLPDWLVEIQTALIDAAKKTPHARELVDRIVVAEFNRHQSSLLFSEVLAAVMDADEDLQAADPPPEDFFEDFNFTDDIESRDTLAEVGQPDAVKRKPDWPKLQKYRAYEKRFRGQRDRCLRLLLILSGSSQSPPCDEAKA